MKYKLMPENKQLNNIKELRVSSCFLRKTVSATREVKSTPKIVDTRNKPVGNCFSISTIFSLLTNVSFFIKRVLLASITSKGIPNNVSQLIAEDKVSLCRVTLAKDEAAKPELIPNQKTKFQNLFLVNQPGCLVGADRAVNLAFTLLFLVKSSMSTCGNYWFKTYSFIISKSYEVLKLIMRVVVVFILCLQGVCKAATPGNNRDIEDIKKIITKAEIQNKIPKGLLAAIAKVESGHREYAINVGGRSVYAGSLAKALSIAKNKIDSGVTNIDLGVMQLNYRWHGDQFTSLEEMLTPDKNINYAAKLLKSLYDQHGNWQKAIRHYHSANLKHSIKYSRKVATVWLANN